MKRVAIFGSAGYLGRQLTHFFRERGVETAGFDRPDCDVTDAAFWASFDPARYDAILFFAGLTGTERGFAEAETYLSVNEGGLLRLLNRLAPLGAAAPKLVFPSTRLVYRGGDAALAEDAPKETKTIYAVNKLACEGYVAAYANRFGLRAAVCRICVPFGSLVPGEASYGTIGFFQKQVAAGQPISLFGGGLVRRTFTHVADICRVVAFLAEEPVEGVYNIGGHAYSLREVAEKVAAGSPGGVRAAPWPREAELLESGSTVFDSSKLDAAWLRLCGKPLTYDQLLS